MSVSNHYLLLDGAQIDNLQRQVFRLQEGADYVTLYRKTAYADLADCGPVLIKTTPDSPLLRHFQAHWQSTAGLQVFSDADPAELQTHLRSLVHARVPGGSTVLFRYHDPRILPLWLETLSAEERDYCMGPVERFVMCDAAGEPVVFERQGPGRPAAPYAAQPWLQLSEAQLERLNEAKQAEFDRRLLGHLQTHFPERLAALDADAQRRLVHSCREGAAQYGYSSAAEVARWSGLVVLLGDDFPNAALHGQYRTLLTQPGRLPAQRLEDALLYAQYQQLQFAKEALA